jgi:opine dehydrogenase
MKIAVIGGGNGAYAAAADLSAKGHEVAMWRRNTKALQSSLTLKDAEGERKVSISIALKIEEALKGAELVFMPDPAFTQADNAKRIAPHLADGQVVFLAPGTFGSWIMAQGIRGENAADVAFAETGTLPWLTRKHGPTTAAITARATRLPTGVYPARKTESALALLKKVFPVERVEDALSAALMNAGPVIHPPLILMNAGPLEHFEKWDIHKEGTQPSIRRVTDALDAERIAARKALGYRAPHFPLADHYRPDGDEWMYGRKVHKKLTDSNDWRERIVLTEHRYMREDVEHGLAFLVSVCEWAGVPCPVARGLLNIGSAVVGKDLRKQGRTLESLGLSGLSIEEMKKRLA